ncbi:MAG: hypothetical protein ACP5U1_12190 [Desulfomonilaceae bacterium]
MTKRNYVAMLLMMFLFLGVFVSPPVLAQDIEQQRDQCIRECHENYPSDDANYWEYSSMCVNKCQKIYFKNLHRQLRGESLK